jgi:hypothetical protein
MKKKKKKKKKTEDVICIIARKIKNIYWSKGLPARPSSQDTLQKRWTLETEEGMALG